MGKKLSMEALELIPWMTVKDNAYSSRVGVLIYLSVSLLS